MEKKVKFGFESQNYEPPRAESVGMNNQGLLCASPNDINGALEGFETGNGSWGHP